MQHAIGEHALLADGRTAALVDPAGNIAWLCWPRVDSSPVLFSLLDDTQGGCFSLRPATSAIVASRSYHDAGLVLREERGKWSYFRLDEAAFERVAVLTDLPKGVRAHGDDRRSAA